MASDRVTTYSAANVALSISGVPITSGYAEGEFVSVEMQSDDTSDKVGADGEVGVAQTNDKRATIKIKLLQGSQGNDALTALRNLGMVEGGEIAIGTFSCTDLSSGVELAHAAKAWIQKPPTVSRAREIVEYEWTLRGASMVLNPKGNPSV